MTIIAIHPDTGKTIDTQALRHMANNAEHAHRSGFIPGESPHQLLHRLFWMQVVVDPGVWEVEYEMMYSLWHQSEAEFWGPLVGAGEAQRFGYSASQPAWNRHARRNSLDRGVPQWARHLTFAALEEC